VTNPPARLIDAAFAAPPSPQLWFWLLLSAAAMIGNANVVPNAASRPK
jgi:hypothetical protein